VVSNWKRTGYIKVTFFLCLSAVHEDKHGHGLTAEPL